MPNSIRRMKEGKEQKSIQSSTKPDPGYQVESDNVTIRHRKREPRSQSFPSGTTRHQQTDVTTRHQQTNPYNVIFRGVRTPYPPSGSAHVLGMFVSKYSILTLFHAIKYSRFMPLSAAEQAENSFSRVT